MGWLLILILSGVGVFILAVILDRLLILDRRLERWVLRLLLGMLVGGGVFILELYLLRKLSLLWMAALLFVPQGVLGVGF